MSEHDEKDELIGTTFANRYAIHGKLGKGGMAVVYRATDTQMGRDVALKVLRQDVADEVAAKRLIREAKGAGALNHPNIITIFDRGIADERVYIAMEILQGRELSALMEELGAVPVERALQICEQVASALAVAHAEGIIHRDIKPENLFLQSRGGADHVKMLDFSIAKLPKEMVTQQLTRAGSVFGTPHYMAPEQVEGKQAAPQTDLYALGAVLYELIAGEPPYDGNSVIDILLKHVKAPVPSLERPGLTLPDGLNDLVRQMLAKKPQDRPESAEFVRARLAALRDAVRTGQPATPPPASAPPSTPPPQAIAQPIANMETAAPPPVAQVPKPATQMPRPVTQMPKPATQMPRPVTQAPRPAPVAAKPPTMVPAPATPADALDDNERTIVGTGITAQVNELVKAQRAAAQAKPVPHLVPPPADDADEAKTMAVSRETLQQMHAGQIPGAAPTEDDRTVAVSKETIQALQEAQAARRNTLNPQGPARAPTSQQPRATAPARAGNRETVTDLPPPAAPAPVAPAQSSKLWLVGVAIGAGLAGAAFAYWFVNR